MVKGQREARSGIEGAYQKFTSFCLFKGTLSCLSMLKKTCSNICELSRENVPCKIRLNGRVRGKLTGHSQVVKSFSRLK